MKSISFLQYSVAPLIGSATCLALLLTGCQSFEELNTNRQGVTIEMGARDGVSLGGQIQAMMTSVVPVGNAAANKTDIANEYQVAYHLGPDAWSGYFGETGGEWWNKGSNFTTFFALPGWTSQPFKTSYTRIFTPWLTIKNSPIAKQHPEVFALAQILKVATWHKATDYVGPIPYTQAGQGAFNPPYDAQDVVYKAMLKDLDESAQVLTAFAKQGGKLFPEYDIIYQGDTYKWVKYANSLMLRLAMRTVYVDEALAKEYAEKAVNGEIGVMTAKEDQAAVNPSVLGLTFENNIEVLVNQYGEARMGVPMYSYLVGLKDPRLMTYYKPAEAENALYVDFARGKYLPMATGWDGANQATTKLTSLPNIEKSTPTYWLRTSEVLFLRAEGALRGWNMRGDAGSLYTQGVEMSFDENGIPISAVTAYLNSGAEPVAVNVGNPINHNFEMKSKTNARWEGSQEQKLEKIITQKWIALFPNGMEAWTEWRRTGYPYIADPVYNRSGGVVGNDTKVRRMVYPISNGRSAEDQAVYEKAVSLLGGSDSFSTKLWWDQKK